MSTIPSLASIQGGQSHSDSPLSTFLTLLFEHSPILISVLEPELAEDLADSSPLSSYAQLIDKAIERIRRWDLSSQARFIAGHPRIGESKNLSTLSAKEQGGNGASAPTPPQVLARLEHLNACYETRYPGLRYITFVNGRSRAVIAEEMEDVLGFEHSLSPNEPSIDSVEVEGENWKGELHRAIEDIGKIAKSRLTTLEVQ